MQPAAEQNARGNEIEDEDDAEQEPHLELDRLSDFFHEILLRLYSIANGCIGYFCCVIPKEGRDFYQAIIRLQKELHSNFRFSAHPTPIFSL